MVDGATSAGAERHGRHGEQHHLLLRVAVADLAAYERFYSDRLS
ncbi:hypothetical protein ACFSKW_06290 [Nonomuraea mangrovi]|uniref:VOC family protein n=1 Tax=Nonomuraea mangrovi TaxID=2316207 RepID=A0ABW4SND9_9ACTN